MKTFSTIIGYIATCIYRIILASLLIVITEHVTETPVPMYIWVALIFAATFSVLHNPSKLEKLSEYYNE